MENKFTIDQKALSSILAAMQPICNKRTTIDATNYILFQIANKEIVLKSTDLEISLQSSCVLQESSVKSHLSFLVSGKRLFDVVKELEGILVCTFTGTQLRIKAEGVNLALNVKDTEAFPPFPERIENLMHMDSTDLKEMLDGVSFVIPQSNSNSALNGLLLEVSDDAFSMTTTDGHSLARVSSKKYTLGEPKSWLIPRRAVFELKKILDTSNDKTIFLGTCANQLVFSGDLFNFFTKLLSDSFPNYKPILSKSGFIPAKIDRSKFIKTLKRSSCLLSGQFLATRFRFDNSSLHVAMNNKDVGNLEEDLEIISEETINIDTRFYSPYLLNGLQVLSDAQAAFYLKNNNKPIIFESIGQNFTTTYLVMPVSSSN